MFKSELRGGLFGTIAGNHPEFNSVRFPDNRAVWHAIGSQAWTASRARVEVFPFPKKAWWYLRRFWRYLSLYEERRWTE